MFHSEDTTKIALTPKAAFIGGAVGGVLVLCTIGFFILLGMTLRGSSPWLTAGGAANTNPPTAPTPLGQQPTPTANVDVKNVKVDGEPVVGKANAPVTLAYWRDYMCSFCKQFEQATLPSIMDQYVNTGKVKIIFKDFAFLGPDSTTAAIASRAVWEVAPAKWYDWQKAVFDKQGAAGWASKDNLIAITKTVAGIDANKVSQLMTNKQAEYQQQIDADKAEGTQMGVTGTPGFVTGTQLITGAEAFATFQQIIDAQLE